MTGSRRKGELSSGEIDRRWPHQVPVDSSRVAGPHYLPVSSLGACSRGHSIVIGDVWHIVFCFAALEKAQAFADQFGAPVKDAGKRKRVGVWTQWVDK